LNFFGTRGLEEVATGPNVSNLSNTTIPFFRQVSIETGFENVLYVDVEIWPGLPDLLDRLGEYPGASQFLDYDKVC